jgi:aminoglycoside 3-N-acetyltransferase
MTSIRQIQEAITQLGIEGSSVVVHSSLSSFGQLEEGVEGLIAALQERFKNVMMPAFSTTFITRPPIDDHPAQNGCDYDDPDLWKLNAQDPFDFDKIKVDPRMGKIAQDFALTPKVVRSRHPWHGWSVSGDNSKEWTRSHPWEETHSPMEYLLKSEGWLLLMGVDLRSCTAIHVAEEKAGRNSFIRWARNKKGGVSRVRVSGCAKGFHQMEPLLGKVIQKMRVGNSEWRVARVCELIDESKKLICNRPEITRCSCDCLRCQDAILGGPR